MYWTKRLTENFKNVIVGGPWLPAYLVVEHVDTDEKMLVMRNLFATPKFGVCLCRAERR